MKLLFIQVSSILFFIFIGCSQRQDDIQSEIPKVKEVVDAFTKTLEMEDLEMFEKISAKDEDMVSFGTDATERWVGYTSLKEAVQNKKVEWHEYKVPEEITKNKQ